MPQNNGINVGRILTHGLLTLGFIAGSTLTVLFGFYGIKLLAANPVLLPFILFGLGSAFFVAGISWKLIRPASSKSQKDSESPPHTPMPHQSLRIAVENAVSQPKHEYVFRIAGKSGSGKTQLAAQYVHGIFAATHEKTASTCYDTIFIPTKDGDITLQLWQVPNHRAGSMHDIDRRFYNTTQGFLLVFDVCDKDSFEYAKNLCDQVSENKDNKYNVVLVGNKIDDESRRQVTVKEAQEFARSKGIIYREVSAKTSFNLNEFFEELVNMVHQRLTGKAVEVNRSDEQNEVKESSSSTFKFN